MDHDFVERDQSRQRSSPSNSGNAYVHFSVAQNTSHFTRSGVILVAGQIIPVSQSGVSGSLQTSEFGAGTLSFWWKVSSETNNDTLRFYLNGIEQMRISGEVGWQYGTFTVPPGTNRFEWRYSKDASTSAGQDAGWVDQVQFLPATNAGCSIVLSPSSYLHGFASGPNTFTITAASSCNWTVRNTNAWISIVTPLDGTGNGSVNYVVAANPTAFARSGNINVNGQNFLVTQAAGSSEGCTISILPGSRAHGSGSATGTVAVTTQNGCAWNVLKTNSWISILSSSNNSNSAPSPRIQTPRPAAVTSISAGNVSF